MGYEEQHDHFLVTENDLMKSYVLQEDKLYL